MSKDTLHNLFGIFFFGSTTLACLIGVAWNITQIVLRNETVSEVIDQVMLDPIDNALIDSIPPEVTRQ